MYKTIIIKNSISFCINKIKELKNNLTIDGNFFCIVKNEYLNGIIEKDFMDLIDFGISLGYTYINTIVIPEKTKNLDNILYCVWLVKNKNNYYFNKDFIREKSIWKDIEWGKREKNYNSKGKDPGNVWIPTVDDGNAKITSHILLSMDQIYDKLLSSTLVENDEYLIISDKKINYKYKKNNGVLKFSKGQYADINFGEYVEDYSKKPHSAKVIFDTSEKMSKIQNKTVDLIVTSPPYWDLKDYYKENQIGQESYDSYSNRMYSVWEECYNKLKDEGSLWININIRTRAGKIVLLPKLFVNQCKKIGLRYRGILIWHKSSGIPTSSKNLSDHYEFVLIFTKSDRTKINRNMFEEYKDYKNDNISSKLFWNINRKAGSIGKNTIHPAIFPTELINRIVNIATNENDLVVDPFLGSGTSLIASINNRRSFTGYEFNEGFKQLMEDRFKIEINDNSVKIKFI